MRAFAYNNKSIGIINLIVKQMISYTNEVGFVFATAASYSCVMKIYHFFRYMHE